MIKRRLSDILGTNTTSNDVHPIVVGDHVRSFDFPGVTDCYMEGHVLEIGLVLEGCPRYRISMEKIVRNGVEESLPVPKDNEPLEFFPPVNGTPSMFGGVTNFVVRIKEDAV